MLITVGRVCVPVDPSAVDDFDPDTVPTVGDLLNELDNVPADSEDVKVRRVEGESRSRNSPSVQYADTMQTTSIRL